MHMAGKCRCWSQDKLGLRVVLEVATRDATSELALATCGS
jgi:hypothetical protein